MNRSIVVMYAVNPQWPEDDPLEKRGYPQQPYTPVPSVNDFALVLAKLDLILAALEKLSERKPRRKK